MNQMRFTLQGIYRYEHEVKRSRFVAHAAPLASSAEAPAFLQAVRDVHATHNCWAYKVGSQYRFSDDGEPAGTAGRPILGAVDAQGLDRVMVVVTRYFGGIKLGAGGLVRAYGGVAAECLRQAPKQAIRPMMRCQLRTPFEYTNALYQITEGLKRLTENYDEEGVWVEVQIEEQQLLRLQALLRDVTRGRATLQVLERFE